MTDALTDAPDAVMPHPAHIAARFRAPGPKRILALDGGGVRGIVSLAFLAEIEAMLRARFRKPDLVLSDYFDLIGGTSVGAMIATLLALGKDVAYVRARFEAWAPRIFEARGDGFLSRMFRGRGLRGITSHLFNASVLRGLVQQELFDTRLGSGDLRTGLVIVTKRIDTGSVWPVVNNPYHPYFIGRAGIGNQPPRKGNGEYRLLDLIRASTAAPLYFSPKRIGIFESDRADDGGLAGTFVDGAVSPHNNPALLLFMMAGLSGFNFGGGEPEPRGNRKPWKLGADNLLLISVGTGTHDHKASRSTVSAALDAAYALEGMISDGQQLVLTMLQWMSMPTRNWHIDRMCGDLCHDLLGDGAGLRQPLLTFERYDLVLENQWLKTEGLISEVLSDQELARMRDFTNPGAIAWLAEVAARAAKAQVRPEQLPRSFDHVFSFSPG